MENYLANHKKYNKILFKYLGYNEKEVEYKTFAPHDPTMGFEILRWVLHKINHNPKEGFVMRTIISMRDELTEIYIQEWFDVLRPDGFINVVSHRESCELKKEGTDKNAYQDAVLGASHRTVYNACVDYIIKTT